MYVFDLRATPSLEPAVEDREEPRRKREGEEEEEEEAEEGRGVKGCSTKSVRPRRRNGSSPPGIGPL